MKRELAWLLSLFTALTLIPVKGQPAERLEGNNPRLQESYYARIYLEPTEFGPSNARGQVILRWLDPEEFESIVQIYARGLPPGEYQVEANGFNTSMTVSAHGRGRKLSKTTVVFAAPLIVDPTSVTRILLSTNGVPLLLGDLTLPGKSSSLLRSTAIVEPGPLAPDAVGVASWRRIYRNGERHDRLRLAASRLPANAVFTVIFAETPIGTVGSTAHGRIAFNVSVDGLAGTLRTLQLVSEEGDEALHAVFSP